MVRGDRPPTEASVWERRCPLVLPSECSVTVADASVLVPLWTLCCLAVEFSDGTSQLHVEE